MSLPVAAGSAARAGKRKPETVEQLLVRGNRDAQSALTSIYLLIVSSQGSLQRLQWSFGRWGLSGRKAAAKKSLAKLNTLFREFRELGDEVAVTASPFAPLQEEAERSREVQEAPKDIPSTTAEQLAEIRLLRAGYDEDGHRSALIRAGAALEEARRRLGKPRLTAGQERVLARAEGLRAELLDIRKRTLRSLPPVEKDVTGAHRKGRELVTEDLSVLSSDADCLRTEIDRLRAHYQFNNYTRDRLPGGLGKPKEKG